jgi:two-component system chemotaxis response regulator CheB
MRGPVRTVKAVVIGASAGGLGALSQVLKPLPRDFSAPLMAVIHLPPDRDSMTPSLLNDVCALEVVEAEDKIVAEPGCVYFAPPDYHLLVELDGRLSLSSDDPVLFSRPSIDVLFESAADAYGPNLTAVVLTGANEDGAAGARAVASAGGRVIVQEPQGAYASAMPLAAVAAVPTARVLPLDAIADELLRGIAA